MNIIIEKSNLLDGLKKIGVYVGIKSNVPILSGVKIATVSSEEVELAATDGDTYITTKIAAQVVSDGATVIQYKQFSDFLKKSKAAAVEIETLAENVVNVKAKNINYKLMSADVREFPIPPNSDFNFVTVNIDEYKRIINNTTYALATSESRLILTALNIRTDNGKLHFTATDSHRLARYTISSDLENFEVCPDGAAVKNTLKVIDKNTKEITFGFNNLGFNSRHTLVKIDDTTNIFIRNIEGNYPDISRLIPEDFRTSATIKTSETLESLEMLHTLSKNDRNNLVQMELNGKIELKSTAQEIGEMKAVLHGKKEGDDLKISYSNVYMRETLKALNTDDVKLNFCGTMRPFIATAPGLENAVHLILPVRTY